MKKIIFIPPKSPEHKKLRVAAYCRVSTLGPAQRRSLEWQIKTYRKMISNHPDWIQRQSNKGIINPTYPSGSGKYGVLHTQLLLKHIKEEIRKILGGDITTIKFHRRFCNAIHHDLVKGRNRTKHPVNYFILNYDTLIEDALTLEGISFNDGFVGGATAWWDHLRFGGEEYLLGGNRGLEARVYKLHGSIDWIKPEKSEFPIRMRLTLPKDEIIVSRWRCADACEHRTKIDWAHQIKWLLEETISAC